MNLICHARLSGLIFETLGPRGNLAKAGTSIVPAGFDSALFQTSNKDYCRLVALEKPPINVVKADMFIPQLRRIPEV